MNNYEKIKNMTIDEMAEFIDEASISGEYTCSYCKIYEDWLKVDTDEDITEYCKYNCINGVKQWLQQESEE